MAWKDAETRRAYMRARNKAKREGTWIPRPISEKILCAHCGELFRRSPANRVGRGRNNYCSRACMAAAYRGRPSPKRGPWPTVPCDNCGAFVSRPEWWHKQNAHTFCNRQCFTEWKASNWTGEDNPCWRGGHPPYYGPNWLRQQREARRRDNHRCCLCGTSEQTQRRALDVHHIKPMRLFAGDYRRANALANLVSLCEFCHHLAESFSKAGTVEDWSTLRALTLPLLPPDRIELAPAPAVAESPQGS